MHDVDMRQVATEEEPPEQYKKFPIELSVECFKLPKLELLRLSKYYAKIEIRYGNDDKFRHICTTEYFKGELCPSFVTRAVLPPPFMGSSQQAAFHSTIRVSLHSRKRQAGHALFSLAHLLSSTFDVTPVLLDSERKLAPLQKNTTSTVKIKAQACGKVQLARPKISLSLSCQISEKLQRSCANESLFFTVQRAAPKGQWVPIFRSITSENFFAKRQRHLGNCTVPIEELLLGASDRLIRVELYSLRRRHHMHLGFAQFNVLELNVLSRNQDCIPWTKGYQTGVNAGLRIEKFVDSGNTLFAKFCFMHKTELAAPRKELFILEPFLKVE